MCYQMSLVMTSQLTDWWMTFEAHECIKFIQIQMSSGCGGLSDPKCNELVHNG